VGIGAAAPTHPRPAAVHRREAAKHMRQLADLQRLAREQGVELVIEGDDHTDA
jgi:hypothetical protein